MIVFPPLSSSNYAHWYRGKRKRDKTVKIERELGKNESDEALDKIQRGSGWTVGITGAATALHVHSFDHWGHPLSYSLHRQIFNALDNYISTALTPLYSRKTKLKIAASSINFYSSLILLCYLSFLILFPFLKIKIKISRECKLEIIQI